MDELYIILIECGVHMKLVRLIKTCLNENYSKDHIGKHLCDPSDGLKQGDALLLLLSNFALECAIRNIQKTGWDWN
jgi:hypothetical protein